MTRLNERTVKYASFWYRVEHLRAQGSVTMTSIPASLQEGVSVRPSARAPVNFFKQVWQSSDIRCMRAICSRTCILMVFLMAYLHALEAILFKFGPANSFLGNSTGVWWTDGRTDTPSYRNARTHLNIDFQKEECDLWKERSKPADLLKITVSQKHYFDISFLNRWNRRRLTWRSWAVRRNKPTL